MQFEEDGAEGFDIVVHKIGVVIQQHTGNDGEHQCYDNLCGQ